MNQSPPYRASVAAATLILALSVGAGTSAVASETDPQLKNSGTLSAVVEGEKLKVAKEDDTVTFYAESKSQFARYSAGTESAAPVAYTVGSPGSEDLPEESASKASESEEELADEQGEYDIEESTITADPYTDDPAEFTRVARIDTTSETRLVWPDSISGEKRVFADGKLLAATDEQDLTVDVSDLADQTLQVESTIEDGQISNIELPAVAQAAAGSKNRVVSAVSHKAFIQPKTVSVAPPLSGNCSTAPNKTAYFKGDGRGFSLPKTDNPVRDAKNYRTAQYARVNWESPSGGNNIVTAKGVGTTTKLDNKGKVLGKKTASSKNLKFTKAKKSSTSASITMTADVGDPYCVLGAINYAVKHTLSRAGVVETIGQSRPVPNHEIAIFGANKQGKFGWKFVSKYKSNRWECLVDIPEKCKRINWRHNTSTPAP